jgi:serpin B
MTRLRIRAFLTVAMMTTIANATNSPATQPDAAAASNAFAIDLYGQVSKVDGNICISPYSVNSALDMAAAGAAGSTASQMLAVLHWTGQPGDLPAASASLTAEMLQQSASPRAGDPQISIANALFGQQGYPFEPAFLQVLDKEFNAPLQSVDFAAQPKQACEQINQWAAKKTNDRIKDAIPASAINPATRLVLVDAIYFKAAWAIAFSKSATEDQPFYPHAKEPAQVPTMALQKSLDYFETDALQAVELSYRGSYSMVLLLPKSRDGLPAIEQSLTAENLSQWTAHLAPQLVQVHLPRFKMEASYNLNKPLGKLGMTDAFSRRSADFSGMSREKLNIDQVIHKTYIAVDEAGTEAAAVTAISVSALAMRANPPKPIIFRADHPFLFVLRHRPTGAILFMGRVSLP